MVVSLGFVTIEDIMFVLSGNVDAVGLRLLRMGTALPFHSLMGAVMGYYVAKRQRWRAYLVPLLSHGIYDFPLAAGAEGATAPLWTVVLTVVLIPGILSAAAIFVVQRVRAARQPDKV